MNKKKLALAISAGLAVGVASTTVSASNPFQADKMNQAYNAKSAPIKLAEGNCGKGPNGKCGSDAKDKGGKCGEGKCGDKKDKGGKCGEGKCGASKKSKSGKCGEGKCGS